MRRLVPITYALVVASAVSVVVRSHYGAGPSTGSFAELVVVMAVVLPPSLVAVALTRRRPVVNAIECGLSLLAWVPLGIKGDLSCVDCGLALTIPLFLAVPQAALVVVCFGLAYWERRQRPTPGPDRRAT